MASSHTILPSVNADIASIIEPREITNWCPRPLDPYIYISFSLDPFYKGYYGANLPPTANKLKNYLVEFDTQTIKQLKILIQNEFVLSAEMNHIRYLPSESLTVEAIREKNICFITGTRLNQLEMSKLGTFPVTESAFYYYPNPFQMSSYQCTYYKVVTLSYLNSENLLQRSVEQYIFIHEMGHALANLKHPHPYSPTDVPPYRKIDCTQSVMVYAAHCSPVLKRNQAIFGPKQSLTPALLYHSDPRVRSMMSEVMDGHPIHLGPIDIEAIKNTTDRWKKINSEDEDLLESENEVIEALPNTNNVNYHEDLYKLPMEDIEIPEDNKSYLNSAFSWIQLKLTMVSNNLIMNMLNYAENVVHNCPSYFPNQPRLANNHLHFFASHHVNNASATLLSSSLPLNITPGR